MRQSYFFSSLLGLRLGTDLFFERLRELEKNCFDSFETLFKTDDALLNSHELFVALALPLFYLALRLFGPALPFFVPDLTFIAGSLQRKSFLISSGNLFHKRSLVSYQQSHCFLQIVVWGGTFSRSHASEFTTPHNRVSPRELIKSWAKPCLLLPKYFGGIRFACPCRVP
jgi:hypothetical protein